MDFVSVLREFGVPLGMAMIAVWAYTSGKVVARWAYDEMRADRDAWREAAREATEALSQSNRVAARAVGKVVKQ